MVFSDIGGHMLFNVHDLCIREQQSFVLNLGFGSMGHGTAAPIGAALAAGDRPIVAIIGDAWHCDAGDGAAHRGRVRRAGGVDRREQPDAASTWFGSQLVGNRRADACGPQPPRGRHRGHRPRHGLLGSWVVERPGELGPALKEALAARRPGVIEVRVARDVPPPLGPRAQVIAGFRER
ncbi:MAG: thiamine pyrophosphate-dependent enzyme [Nannocystaceae bacterium]